MGFDPRSAPDDLLLAAHVVIERAELEDEPGDVPIGRDEYLLDLRHPPAYLDRPHWLALDGDQPVGLASLRLPDVPDNRDFAEFELDVVSSARRRGVGSALLRRVVDGAEADGRDLMTAYAPANSPGVAFLARTGFKNRQAERNSRLLRADLDRGLLEGWVAQAPERAVDYELVGWTGPIPDSMVDSFAEVAKLLNTAPLDDVEYEPEVIDRRRVLDNQASRQARGIEPWVLVARHRRTRGPAGYTDVHVNTHRPERAEQMGTAVDPAHRNRGLGRWLKAAMALQLLDQRPALRFIETYNAESNDPMLAINVAMGFRPHRAYEAHQARAPEVRTALG